MCDTTSLDSLMEMGFPRNRAEKALAVTGNQGVNLAMDWLFEHSEDADIDEPYVPPQGNVLDPAAAAATPPTLSLSTESTLAAPRQEGDGDPGESEDGAEGQEPKKMLTEEERQQQLQRLEEKLRQKRLEREEKERQEEIEREKQRRKHGQELASIRTRMQEEEMRKLVEERKREKDEERMAKERVREKIARDREERARKFGETTGAEAVPAAGTAALPATSEPPTSTTATTSPPKRDYDQCRIQVRMPDGSQLMQSFAAKETLAAVRLFVELHRQDEATPFVLLTNFPRRLFGDEDMEKPLSELGLVPSAVLIMTKR